MTAAGRFDPVRLFFSAEGRLARGPFAAAALTLLVLLAALRFRAPGPVRGALGGLVGFVLFVAGCCVCAKRLHDRGHAGWWAAAPMLFLVWAWSQPDPRTPFVASFAAVWGLGVLGSRPGWNRFGPPPGTALDRAS